MLVEKLIEVSVVNIILLGKVGLVYDAGYRGWFYIDENSGMQTGWVLINERWYFFNPVSDGTRGMMFIGRKTPDEYFVTEDGSWDGKTK